MRNLAVDLRDVWRGLRRDRWYAAISVATLALTLSVVIAVFSIVDGVLLKPLAYPDPHALVSIREVVPAISERYPTLPVNLRHFDYWRDRTSAFSAMAATDWRTATLTGVGEASQIRILRASGTLFDVLRTPPLMGRTLTRGDEGPDRPAVTVISESLWRDRLGSDPNVLGRTLTLNGAPFTIVGVLPQGYTLPRLAPLEESGTVTSDVEAITPFRVALDRFSWMGAFNYGVVARAAPGVSLEQARAELAVLQSAVAALASRQTGEAAELRGWVMPLEQVIAGPVRRPLLLLLAAVVVLLLMACANLANLALTRSLRQQRDSAIRGALGAGRHRLARAVVLEQVALALAAGALGTAGAAALLRIFVATAPITIPRAHDVTLDIRVLAFGVAAALVSALVVALLPAWRMGRRDLNDVLRSGGRGGETGVRRAGNVLLMLQAALSVAMLTGAGLLLASLLRLVQVDIGFAPAGAVTVDLAPSSGRYPDVAARAALYDRVLARIRQLPGVTAASPTSALPLTGETWVDAFQRPDETGERTVERSANYRFVGPEYFRAIGMPVLQGRGIEDRDRAAASRPAVLSARAARALWPSGDVLGREFTRGDPAQRFQVVGVVPDGRVTALESEPPLMVYVPYWFNNEGRSVLVVRTDRDARALLGVLRSAVREVDTETPVAEVALLQDVVDRALAGRRYQATLFSAFGGGALLIVLLGVYATTAYAISRRRKELNLRSALGAGPSVVFALVVRQSAGPVAAGVVVGLCGALAVGGALASLLYEVRPREPFVLGGAALLVGVIGLLAAATAARGTLRIDAAAVLRDE